MMENRERTLSGAAGRVVEGNVAPEILEEIERFEREAQRFLREEVHPEVFRRFRLQHGIYGQRQEGVQMVRVKIPFGGLNPVQLRVLADIADDYTPRRMAHVTTRQNVQFHFVKLADVGEIMRRLAAVGLTTREACGNTVRNVTASPHTGVCPHEVFDVTPYALATYRHFIRNPICENLPRKFKIAFSDCTADAGLTPIHDIGLIAKIQEINGQQVPGFLVTVGGGLGPSPRKPYVLEEFVPLGEFLAVCEAVVRVFNRYGNRKNKSKARMKFLIEKIGFEEFYRRYQEEYAFVRETRDPAAFAVPPPQDEPEPQNRPLPLIPRYNGNGHHDPQFDRWKRSNTVSQKQPGYAIVHVRLVIGDLNSGQLRALADIAERYACGQIRSTNRQNFVLRWVREADLYSLYRELTEAGLGLAEAETIGDVVACPGTDTCGLGITGSKGLGRALTELFQNGNGPAEDLQGISIKVSGCPNSCAQHHIASIGFHGLAHKIRGRLVPAYQLHLGGRIQTAGVTFGQPIPLKFPAKRVPDVVRRLIDFYREARQPGEDFLRFVDRMGRARFQELLKPYTELPAYEDGQRDLYHDWDEDHEYELRDQGHGECAGGVVDMIEQHFEDSKYEMANARVLYEKGRHFDALTRADLALVEAARALLVLEGIDPVSNEEVMQSFEARMVAREIIPPDHFNAYRRLVQEAHRQALTPGLAQRYLEAVGALTDRCREAFQKMDASLRIRAEQEAGPAESKATPAAQPQPPEPADSPASDGAVHLDLRGVKCPMNYVKAKLQLEMMEIGEKLELLIDEGEAYENVPRSLRDDGQHILEVEPIDRHYRLLVEKVK